MSRIDDELDDEFDDEFDDIDDDKSFLFATMGVVVAISILSIIIVLVWFYVNIIAAMTLISLMVVVMIITKKENSYKCACGSSGNGQYICDDCKRRWIE